MGFQIRDDIELHPDERRDLEEILKMNEESERQRERDHAAFDRRAKRLKAKWKREAARKPLLSRLKSKLLQTLFGV